MTNPLYYVPTATTLYSKETPPGYYFADETWSHWYGPYATLHAAKKSLSAHLFHLDYGPFTVWKMIRHLFSMWRTTRWVAALPDPKETA